MGAKVKRIIAIALIILTVASTVYAAALNFTPVITLTRLTTTTVRCQLSGIRGTGIDTLKVVGVGDDSLTYQVFFAPSTTTKDTTLTGFVPGSTRIMQVRADSAGVYKYSTPDTVTLYSPQYETPVPTSDMDAFSAVKAATSWPKTGTFVTTLSTSGTTSRDSTIIYDTWPNMGGMAVATGDSVVLSVYCMAGYETGSGTMYFAPCDTLSIASAGVHNKTWSVPVGARHIYFVIAGTTDNGSDTGCTLYLRRTKY